jgi:hypothetical protein
MCPLKRGKAGMVTTSGDRVDVDQIPGEIGEDPGGVRRMVGIGLI